MPVQKSLETYLMHHVYSFSFVYIFISYRKNDDKEVLHTFKTFRFFYI